MVSQTAERVDTKYDEDLTENFVYGANFPNGNLLLVDLQRQDEAGFGKFGQSTFSGSRFLLSFIETSKSMNSTRMTVYVMDSWEWTL